MTTKLIVASMFCVASLFAACGTPGDATGEVEAAPPAHEDESAWGVRRAGDVVEASLGAAARGERELSYPRAAFLRLYFGSLALERGTRLVLEGASGEQATLTAANNGEGVWGPSLEGDRVKLRLERDAPGDLGSYAVAKVGVGTALPDPELPDATGAISSICGANDTVPAACFNTAGHPLQNASVYNASRAVGRLLVAKGSTMLYCTGWLVSNTNLFLTNSHCLNKADEAATLEVAFNFQNTTCTGQTLDATKKTSHATLIQTSEELDFSLLRLPVEVPIGSPTGPVFNPAATFGFIQLDPTTDVRVGNEIYVPQHPYGDRKAVAFLDSESGGDRCRVTAVNVDRPGDAPGANIGYKCDTAGGASGSPVLSTATHRAVALHHAGGCNNPGGNNLGIAIRHIYPKIQGSLENNTCVPSVPPPMPINSCVGRCDKQAPAGCWCDTQCVNYGDCCADRVQACTGLPPTNSCQGRCGSQAPAGCWCHPTCFAHGDCCADMTTFCQ